MSNCYIPVAPMLRISKNATSIRPAWVAAALLPPTMRIGMVSLSLWLLIAFLVCSCSSLAQLSAQDAASLSSSLLLNQAAVAVRSSCSVDPISPQPSLSTLLSAAQAQLNSSVCSLLFCARAMQTYLQLKMGTVSSCPASLICPIVTSSLSLASQTVTLSELLVERGCSGSVILARSSSTLHCSGVGQWNSSTSYCHCPFGFVGASCASLDTSLCPGCDLGTCTADGDGTATCACDVGVLGSDCSITAASLKSYSLASLARLADPNVTDCSDASMQQLMLSQCSINTGVHTSAAALVVMTPACARAYVVLQSCKGQKYGLPSPYNSTLSALTTSSSSITTVSCSWTNFSRSPSPQFNWVSSMTRQGLATVLSVLLGPSAATSYAVALNASFSFSSWLPSCSPLARAVQARCGVDPTSPFTSTTLAIYCSSLPQCAPALLMYASCYVDRRTTAGHTATATTLSEPLYNALAGCNFTARASSSLYRAPVNSSAMQSTLALPSAVNASVLLGRCLQSIVQPLTNAQTAQIFSTLSVSSSVLIALLASPLTMSTYTNLSVACGWNVRATASPVPFVPRVSNCTSAGLPTNCALISALYFIQHRNTLITPSFPPSQFAFSLNLFLQCAATSLVTAICPSIVAAAYPPAVLTSLDCRDCLKWASQLNQTCAIDILRSPIAQWAPQWSALDYHLFPSVDCATALVGWLNCSQGNVQASCTPVNASSTLSLPYPLALYPVLAVVRQYLAWLPVRCIVPCSITLLPPPDNSTTCFQASPSVAGFATLSSSCGDYVGSSISFVDWDVTAGAVIDLTQNITHCPLGAQVQRIWLGVDYCGHRATAAQTLTMQHTCGDGSCSPADDCSVCPQECTSLNPSSVYSGWSTQLQVINPCLFLPSYSLQPAQAAAALQNSTYVCKFGDVAVSAGTNVGSTSSPIIECAVDASLQPGLYPVSVSLDGGSSFVYIPATSASACSAADDINALQVISPPAVLSDPDTMYNFTWTSVNLSLTYYRWPIGLNEGDALFIDWSNSSLSQLFDVQSVDWLLTASSDSFITNSDLLSPPATTVTLFTIATGVPWDANNLSWSVPDLSALVPASLLLTANTFSLTPVFYVQPTGHRRRLLGIIGDGVAVFKVGKQLFSNPIKFLFCIIFSEACALYEGVKNTLNLLNAAYHCAFPSPGDCDTAISAGTFGIIGPAGPEPVAPGPGAGIVATVEYDEKEAYWQAKNAVCQGLQTAAELPGAIYNGDLSSALTNGFHCPCTTCSCTTDCGSSGTGTAFGDPHFTTLDGLSYDFQGQGAFWLLNDMRSGITFAVQSYLNYSVRHDGVQADPVTYHTALAIQAAFTTIMLQPTADLNPITNAYIDIYVNGLLLHLVWLSAVSTPSGCPYRFAGGSMYRASPQSIIVDFDLGYTVSVSLVAGWNLLQQVSVTAPGQARSYLLGLLGNFDGNPLNDWTDWNGTDYQNVYQGATSEAAWAFGQSMAVSPTLSLFVSTNAVTVQPIANVSTTVNGTAIAVNAAPIVANYSALIASSPPPPTLLQWNSSLLSQSEATSLCLQQISILGNIPSTALFDACLLDLYALPNVSIASVTGGVAAVSALNGAQVGLQAQPIAGASNSVGLGEPDMNATIPISLLLNLSTIDTALCSEVVLSAVAIINSTVQLCVPLVQYQQLSSNSSISTWLQVDLALLALEQQVFSWSNNTASPTGPSRRLLQVGGGSGFFLPPSSYNASVPLRLTLSQLLSNTSYVLRSSVLFPSYPQLQTYWQYVQVTTPVVYRQFSSSSSTAAQIASSTMGSSTAAAVSANASSSSAARSPLSSSVSSAWMQSSTSTGSRDTTNSSSSPSSQPPRSMTSTASTTSSGTLTISAAHAPTSSSVASAGPFSSSLSSAATSSSMSYTQPLSVVSTAGSGVHAGTSSSSAVYAMSSEPSTPSSTGSSTTLAIAVSVAVSGFVFVLLVVVCVCWRRGTSSSLKPPTATTEPAGTSSPLPRADSAPAPPSRGESVISDHEAGIELTDVYAA